MTWSIISVLLLTYSTLTLGQSSECSIKSSPTSPSMVDVTCICDQQLTNLNIAIHHLTINSTGCTISGLALDWEKLETLVKPQVLVLEGSSVVLPSPSRRRAWESSITHIYFINCEFESISSGAFSGLNQLQELRFLNSAIEVINSGAVSFLENLKVLEISRSTIKKIGQNSFRYLPNINEFAISYSEVGLIETNSIHNVITSFVDELDCLDEASNDIMGRSLHFTHNLTLPEDGNKVVLYKNSIDHIHTNAFTGNTFSYLIMGGNTIRRIDNSAFNLELHNGCDLSAFLLIGNTINQLDSRSLVDIGGSNNSKTFLAFSNNTFTNVKSKGFLMDEDIKIFTVNQNSFHCDCEGFDWVLSRIESEPQRELERQLLTNSTCVHSDISVLEFSYQCFDNIIPSHNNANNNSPSFPSSTVKPHLRFNESTTSNVSPNHESSLAITPSISYLAIAFYPLILLLS